MVFPIGSGREMPITFGLTYGVLVFHYGYGESAFYNLNKVISFIYAVVRSESLKWGKCVGI